MSYDLEVWSVETFATPPVSRPEDWRLEGDQWTHGGREWQISVFGPTKAADEDIPEQVIGALAGIQYLTTLHLEGRAPKSAQALLKSTARDIARATHGLVLDRQTDEISLPSGVKRLRKAEKSQPSTAPIFSRRWWGERWDALFGLEHVTKASDQKATFDLLAFNWWFLDGPMSTRDGRRAFLEFLQRSLPEAIPRRYGLFEPPQFTYAETGREHFLDFWEAHINDGLVLYAHKPVALMHFGFPKPLGAHKLGFRANHIEIGIDLHALETPGWAEQLRRFWEDASRMISPFFGEVRILSGYSWSGSRTWTSRATEQHPTMAWWWRGIPSTLGNAIVVGEPYLSLWPSLRTAGQVTNSLAFASTNDWRIKTDVRTLIGETPAALQQPPTPEAAGPRDKKYPEAWPFGPPFST